MTRLTLLRHAKSSWDEPGQRDIDRPLNPRGSRDAPLMGTVCREKLPVPDLIVLSPARRTRETIDAFIEAWGISEVDTIVDDRLYLAGISDWEDVLEEHGTKRRHILGCAHQPGIGNLAYRLDPSFSADVPTAAVISLVLEDIRRGPMAASVDFYGIPREYR